jgi:putative endonuclease
VTRSCPLILGILARVAKAKRSTQWFVYMLWCGPRRFLYTGRTTDVERRFEEHRSGTGARYTRAYRPTAVAWFESGHDASSSGKREAQIKRLSRSAKLALIAAGPAKHRRPRKRKRTR